MSLKTTAYPEGSNAKQPTLHTHYLDTNNNPFPLPPSYSESAHFVRQWWPSLLNIPRVRSTVVLLAEHDQVSHRLHFVLAQHSFRVPVNHDNYNSYRTASGLGVNCVTPPPLRPFSSSSSGSQPQPPTTSTSTSTSTTSLSTPTQIEQDDGLMHLWYVRCSTRSLKKTTRIEGRLIGLDRWWLLILDMPFGLSMLVGV
ncbi:uncharacterized protein LACBIDRAFT_308956 [Laccaria bicolor S238N-H82]|uniref:Predicted protein n=1 Tax=Laccaria bicolor (strain S238N-H82 / ATCC MYA-4686) TaxID=486041 RepID=B0CV66_LACBS|nr:uncharacterized protein LACBIDRAFT_308956 [Laccaria bicolor S238N-H82]EDR13695.1 predicted protein [Laccaria bicolor S238N-H82]|eukprot:XP_001876193.1 predicted protein [Laccaria bicolor S238N-H82]